MARQVILIEGLSETMQALRTIDPEFRKLAAKDISAPAKEIVAKRKADIPDRILSNWGRWSRRGGRDRDGGRNWSAVGALNWDARATGSGRNMGVRTSGAKLQVVLFSNTPYAAAFETIGRQNRSTTTQGAAFIESVKRRWGPAPRFLIRTWREEKGMTRTAETLIQVSRRVEKRIMRVVG